MDLGPEIGKTHEREHACGRKDAYDRRGNDGK